MNRRKKHTLALRLQYLAQAIASVSDASRVHRLSHAEVESLIEFYVDSEKRGEKAQALYPAVWSHLQSCGHCRASYTLLTEATPDGSSLENDRPHTARLAPTLPFLAAQTKDAAWTKHVRSRVGGAPLRFGFTIHPVHLRTLFASTLPVTAMRDQPSPTRRALLLSDTFALGQREVVAELWTQRGEDPTQIQIEVVLVSSSPLPDPLRVSIRWNDRHYSGLIQQGRTILGGIPTSDLESARDLRVDFEEVQPSAI